MRRKIKSIFKSEIIRNASILVSGNMLGQIIAFLATMAITRIYTDADLGIFGYFMSITSILVFFATGKYEEAIVIAKDETEAKSLGGIILRWSFLFSLLLFVVLLLWRVPIFHLFRMDSLNEYWALIPLATFLFSISFVLINIANRKKNFKSIAASNFTQNTVSSLSKIAVAPVLAGGWGLIVGQIIGQIAACIPFYRQRVYVKESLLSKWSDMKKAIRKYKEFPQYNMPRSLISTLSASIPFLFLTGVFGEAKLGLFFLAFNMSFRPINLLMTSFYQVFIEKAASLRQENKKISPIIYPYWKKNILFILPLFILLFFIAPDLFGLLFGEEWRESGKLLRYILPWRFMMLFNQPMDFIPLIFNKQQFYLRIEILALIVRLAAIYVGIYFQSFEWSILLYGAAGFVYLLFNFTWYNLIIRKYEREMAST